MKFFKKLTTHFKHDETQAIADNKKPIGKRKRVKYTPYHYPHLSPITASQN